MPAFLFSDAGDAGVSRDSVPVATTPRADRSERFVNRCGASPHDVPSLRYRREAMMADPLAEPAFIAIPVTADSPCSALHTTL